MWGLSSDFEQFFLVKNNLLTSVHNDADDPDDYNRVIGIIHLKDLSCANDIAISKENQDILSSQIQDIFNFLNLTYMETDTNRLFLWSLHRDILQINSIVHHLSKELKALFHDRNLFIIMFQLRHHLSHSLQWNKFSSNRYLLILNQVLVISS